MLPGSGNAASRDTPADRLVLLPGGNAPQVAPSQAPDSVLPGRAGGCDMWLIFAYGAARSFPLPQLGLVTAGTGAGVVAFGLCYDRRRRRGLALLVMLISVSIVAAYALDTMSWSCLMANGICSVG